MLGMTNCFLAVSRRQTVQVETMFSGFSNFLNAMLLYIINAVLIALWSCLLVIPGIIKYFSYSMSYYILADHPELSANEARKHSMVLMQGNRWRLFCLEFSFIGWLILCALTCGILTFWIQPYMEVACCEFYHSLINKDTTQPEFDQTTGDGSTVEQTDFYTNTENN
jgi:uncharacterized membrane protein